MADNQDKRAATLAFWGTRVFTASSRVAAFFATRISRSLIVVVFVLSSLYVAYRQAWEPVLATAALPPGVAEQSPQLNTDLLKAINAQRIERIEAKRLQFPVGPVLQPPPPSSS